MPSLLPLLLQCASTGWMTAVIWFVQLVHYPLFAAVGRAEFAAYERDHTRRIAWVVAPPMLLELATAIWTVVAEPPWATQTEAVLGLLLAVLLWLSTFALQVPEHERLQQGFDEASLRRLVRTNWLRTALWTLRALLVGRYLLRALA